MKNKDILPREVLKMNNLNYSYVYDNSMNNILEPGSLYHIDANIADLYLVSSDRNKIVGRPTIYLVIDMYSRIITGVYIDYEYPSWIGAKMALSNAVSDKVKYCKEYGIDIEKDEWNIDRIPKAIIVDIDESKGTSLKSLINSLGINIQNTPKYRAYCRGIVQSAFNIIRLEYEALTSEYIMKNSKFGYRLHSGLDIYEFTQIIIKSILKYNNHTYIRGYNSSHKEIEDNIILTPKKIWDLVLENKIDSFKSVDSAEVMK